jgi:hypothetical protein
MKFEPAGLDGAWLRPLDPLEDERRFLSPIANQQSAISN